MDKKREATLDCLRPERSLGGRSAQVQRREARYPEDRELSFAIGKRLRKEGRLQGA